MAMSRCPYCRLPMRIHFAWCWESEIVGKTPPEALRPGAIIFETGELRAPTLGAWIDRRSSLSKKPRST